MTPADEATFIQLWQQGVDSATIGRQLGIPRGTVSSRASTLVRQGKIQPRPRGGAYPRQQALAQQEGPPRGHPHPHPRHHPHPPATPPRSPWWPSLSCGT